MTICKVKNSMFNLQTFVGDSGLVGIGNIPTDKPDYILYMEIRGKKKVEKVVQLNGSDSTVIEISVEDTTDLGAGQWPYGVKLCSGADEDTYIPDLRIAPNALFIVKPMAVGGAEE